jgi:hypothetical protein
MTLPYPWHVDYTPRRRRKEPLGIRDGNEFIEIYDRVNPGKLVEAFRTEARP